MIYKFAYELTLASGHVAQGTVAVSSATEPTEEELTALAAEVGAPLTLISTEE